MTSTQVTPVGSTALSVRTPGNSHSAAVSSRAWLEDARARDRGRVQMFNATRPDGLDGWTVAVEQYELLVDIILKTIDAFSAEDGTVLLQVIVNEAQNTLGAHPAFPNGRLPIASATPRSISRPAASLKES
ncbi:hypothetical protein ACX80O_07475 [Arthrobacter sp. Hz1]